MRVELRGVEVQLGGETVLHNVDLTLEGPGLVQVLGPNGAGKTTLLRTILGLVKPVRGRVLVDGVDVTGRPEAAGRLAGYVPQLEPARHHYPVTAWELVETECLIRTRPWPRLSGAPCRDRVAEALGEAGLPREAWGKPLHSLSGGQQQRTLIARALVHNPRILVMDEPLSAVDPAGKAELAEKIAALAHSRLVIVTSHDPMLLLEHTKTIVLVNRGIVAAGPPAEVLTRENLEKVYGKAILYVEQHLHIADEHHHTRPRSRW